MLLKALMGKHIKRTNGAGYEEEGDLVCVKSFKGLALK